MEQAVLKCFVWDPLQWVGVPMDFVGDSGFELAISSKMGSFIDSSRQIFPVL
jgi:hypothetical protein